MAGEYSKPGLISRNEEHQMVKAALKTQPVSVRLRHMLLLQLEDERCLQKDPLCILKMSPSEGKGHSGGKKRVNSRSLFKAREP